VSHGVYCLNFWLFLYRYGGAGNTAADAANWYGFAAN